MIKTHIGGEWLCSSCSGLRNDPDMLPRPKDDPNSPEQPWRESWREGDR